MSDRILRRRETEHKSGLCERKLRNLENEGKFPRRFLIAESGRAIGWSEAEVDAWLSRCCRNTLIGNGRDVSRTC